jgi:hypothetical protein
VKNIVICRDGTGNEISENISNVLKLYRCLERFPAKACPALDAGWIPVRVKKTRQNKKARAPFRFHWNGKGSSSLLKNSFWA